MLPGGVMFPHLSNGNYVYVDKTPIIKRLVTRPKGAFFINRPRRFGKSLLVRTLAEYFKGNREAFKGTAIYDDL